jgi:GDP-L-fucose synthase
MNEEYLLSGYLEPTNQPYAVAKIAGIEMCQSYNRQHRTQYISVMPTNLYGPNDNFDLETSHVLPALIRKFHLGKLAAVGDWEAIQKDETCFGRIPDDIMKNLVAISSSSGYSPPESLQAYHSNASAGPEITLWGTGKPRRELLHVDDLADACVFLMNTYEGGDIINIGTGKDSTIRELSELVADIVGFKVGMRFDSSKPDGTPQKLLDVSRLRNLGWESKISLRDGIRNTYQWYRGRC